MNFHGIPIQILVQKYSQFDKSIFQNLEKIIPKKFVLFEEIFISDINEYESGAIYIKGDLDARKFIKKFIFLCGLAFEEEHQDEIYSDGKVSLEYLAKRYQICKSEHLAAGTELENIKIFFANGFMMYFFKDPLEFVHPTFSSYISKETLAKQYPKLYDRLLELSTEEKERD
jgi:hypothetical protein